MATRGASLRMAWMASLLIGGGCVSRSDLRTVEAKNRVLSEQNRIQQAEIANLREHQRKLEDQLIRGQAETDGSSVPRQR